MQARRTKKRAPVFKQPAWEEWLSREGTEATASTGDPGGNRMHQAIANLAYSYWEARGRQGGSAEEDWLRAEEKMKRQRPLDALN
jgi:Protein of unknown function (DUF2934)